jgi:hypothetical protein
MEWQTYLAIALFLTAAAVIGRRAWIAMFGSAGSCSTGCGSCSGNAASELLKIEELK